MRIIGKVYTKKKKEQELKELKKAFKYIRTLWEDDLLGDVSGEILGRFLVLDAISVSKNTRETE